MDTGNYQ